MRIIAFLLIAGGIGLGLVWPWAQLNLEKTNAETLAFGDLQGAVVERQTIELTEADNPIRVRFQIAYTPDGALPPVKLPVKIVITDSDGTLLTGTVSFPTAGRETGPEQPKVRSGTLLNFNVINDGEHEFFLELASNPNDGGITRPAIEGVDVSIVKNAAELRDDYKALAAVMALAGVYVLIRSRRSKRKSRKEDRKKKPEPRKWGRGG